MNIRSVNTGYAALSTQTFAQQVGNTSKCGGLFIGGKGSAVVANKTDGFHCAGGESNLYITNQGERAKIQLGGGSNYEKFKVNGEEMAFKNIVLSAGNYALINGSCDADVIFSYGAESTINLNGGNDYAFINGAKTKVNGSDSSEYISGVPSGLPSIFELQQLTPYNFIQKITNSGINIIYKNIFS